MSPFAFIILSDLPKSVSWEKCHHRKKTLQFWKRESHHVPGPWLLASLDIKNEEQAWLIFLNTKDIRFFVCCLFTVNRQYFAHGFSNTTSKSSCFLVFSSVSCLFQQCNPTGYYLTIHKVHRSWILVSRNLSSKKKTQEGREDGDFGHMIAYCS